MSNRNTIGIDLGGTYVRAAWIKNGKIMEITKERIPSNGSVEDVLTTIYSTVNNLQVEKIDSIGIGIPSVVDTNQGVVYDVQNIPSWKEVPVKRLFEARYNVPVFVNNDANCFILGEKSYGKAQEVQNVIGLITGTGFAGGIVINGKLYEGKNCGAGEFGMMPYLDTIYEDYCSGQYFIKKHSIMGDILFQKAESGDKSAQDIFKEYGFHLGMAVKAIIYAYDPDMIVIGGSVKQAYPYYKTEMWEVLNTIAYRNTQKSLRIEVSGLENAALYGAAELDLYS